MFAAIKNNIYPAIALTILPVGYFIGTELRERNDARKQLLNSYNQGSPSTEEEIAQLKQQLETLREEREMVLSKIKKTE